LAKDRGWDIDYHLPSVPAKPEFVRAGVEFTETMRGYFSLKVLSTNTLDDYQRASQQGERDSSPFEFTLTISSDDLERMLTDQPHSARMVGTVKAHVLSPEPLTVTEGVFNLFVDDPDHADVKLMKYRMKLTSEEGKTFYFEGFKVVRHHPVLKAWPDTSTLYITIYDGDSSQSPVKGKGVLKIYPADFMRQLTTMKVTNAPNAVERLKALGRFGGFFGDVLLQTYGGVFAKSTPFDPVAPPRKSRQLDVDAPDLHPFMTKDQVPLLLTRYKGGDKGPVILSHGLGVSSLIFSIDTIETNLLEYLFSHGYDVWLLDYRASIAMPSSYQGSSADDVATLDYPAAVAKVREVTDAETVQMVVHCFGSTTFFMAMLAGLEGVRSAVCSQIANDVRAVPLTRFKSGLHVPDVLARLEVKSLTAYVTTHTDWKDRLFDEALKLYPLEAEEHCNSDVCHRITFLYSLLYEHAQLNEATHNALHEMFGVANIKALEHLARLVRTGHLVDFNGAEVYMPHLGRLAIPISFIHGAQNQCFLPESTAITYESLRAKNGQYLYDRQLIPGYGHIDCIFGRNAVRDVYPFVLSHLEETAIRRAKVSVATGTK
jgi:cholesterol oxidase